VSLLPVVDPANGREALERSQTLSRVEGSAVEGAPVLRSSPATEDGKEDDLCGLPAVSVAGLPASGGLWF